MSFGKLGYRLIVELKRSPAKSATLGVAIVVALYSWTPLFSKMHWKPHVAAQAVQVTPVIQTQAVTPIRDDARVPATVGQAGNLPWDLVVKWIEQDRSMTPAMFAEDMRNPFARSGVARLAVEAERSSEVTVSEIEELDATTCGLVLDGTIVGRRKRLAIINGSTYAEGAELTLSGDSDTADDTSRRAAVLLEIQRGSVLVKFQGQTVRLKVAAAALNARSQWMAGSRSEVRSEEPPLK